MTKLWSYHVATINTEYDTNLHDPKESGPATEFIERELQLLGDDGWELVTFLPARPAAHFQGGSANPWVFYAVFKQPQ
jgi:hypothetical protein